MDHKTKHKIYLAIRSLHLFANMFRFILSRLSYGAIVLVLVTLIVSSIVYLAPVDPARLTFGQRMDDTTVEEKRKQLGLDLSLREQLVLYLKDLSPVILAANDQWKDAYRGVRIQVTHERFVAFKWPYLRTSYQTGRPVSEMLANAFPNTLILALTSIFLAILLGLVLGIIAAFFQGSFLDNAIILFSTIGYSVPSYVTAIVLGVVFGFYFRDITGLNIQGSLFELNDYGDEKLSLKNLILPSIALGIRPVSIVAQLMRSSMIQVLQEKYVLAAFAKGLSNLQLIRNHVIKNAMNPVVTALSGWFAALLAGAFFVEFIFNFKGLGFITVTALLNYDIPVILGALLLSCTLFILINILVDLTYRILDPRIEINS